jgi:hypothetical protein
LKKELFIPETRAFGGFLTILMPTIAIKCYYVEVKSLNT